MVLQRLRQKIDDLYDQFYDILEKTDFSIPTFLAFGAVFQLLSIAYLPPTLSTSLPLLWLGWRLARSTLASRDVFRTSFTDVVRGVHTTKLPESSDGVVVFILGARLNQCVNLLFLTHPCRLINMRFTVRLASLRLVPLPWMSYSKICGARLRRIVRNMAVGPPLPIFVTLLTTSRSRENGNLSRHLGQ
jgi:hypothetical protein